jgi:hypothetical protein
MKRNQIIRLSFQLYRAAIMAVFMNSVLLGAQNTTITDAVSVTDKPSPGASTDVALSERDWGVATAESLAAKPPSSAQIQSFIMSQLDIKPPDAIVCSAGFFQLSGSASYSLIASMDYSGRHFCNEVVVINRRADSFPIQRISAWEVDDVKDTVRDLGKNGESELVVPTAYSGYNGVECIATWSLVYKLQGDSLVDQSASFLDVYRARLDVLNAKIQEAADEDATCVQMEADKIARFLGTSPNAGEDRAITWLNSADQSLRLKGIVVLADIRDDKSIVNLQHLTEDPDTIVSGAARLAVDTIRKK